MQLSKMQSVERNWINKIKIGAIRAYGKVVNRESEDM